MKHEAGGVLGEVKRKQTDATKAVELLKALRKLREARKQEAEVKGNNRLTPSKNFCFHLREIAGNLYLMQASTITPPL